MSLSDRTAIITGANGHLGQAVATAFAAAGARVALLGRDAAALQAVADALPAGALVVPCDVTDEASVQAAFARVNAELGGPHLLLNVVGGYAGGQKVPELDLATWQHMLSLNLTSAFLCCKHAVPYMQAADYGRIVNVSSKVALDLPAASAAYAVSKAALNAFTTCLAKELKGGPVSVAAVMPSVIDTPPNREAMPKADPAKWVTPAQLAEVLVLLCSETAGAMNGALVPVFGGV